MPIERRPAHPLPKGPRPESRNPPHRVADNESLESVASRYGVPVQALMVHNFGTLDPAEVNWYLREYVGCKQSTRDGRNWRFSSAANPGLIYVPLGPQPPHLELILGQVRVTHLGRVENLDDESSPWLPGTTKFQAETSIPKTPEDFAKYFMGQWKFAIEGEIRLSANSLKLTFNKKSLKAALEVKLSKTAKMQFSLKAEDTLEKAVKAIRNGGASGKADLGNALVKAFEPSVKVALGEFAGAKISGEAGLALHGTFSPDKKWSLNQVLPMATIRSVADWEGVLSVEGVPVPLKFTMKGGFNVGFSKQGWLWIADKVGRPALRAFVAGCEGVEAFLVSEGVLATVALPVTLGVAWAFSLTALLAWAVQSSKNKADLEALRLWYVSAYCAKVFGDDRPTGPIAFELAPLRDQLVAMAEQDAVRDARAILQRANDPLATRGSDAEVLVGMMQLARQMNQMSDQNAKQHITRILQTRLNQIVRGG